MLLNALEPFDKPPHLRGQMRATREFATVLGARVIATSRRDENQQAVKRLGAVGGIKYRTTPDGVDEVLKLTEGGCVVLLLDVAGGSGFNQSVAATKASRSGVSVRASPPSARASRERGVRQGGDQDRLRPLGLYLSYR